MSGDLCFEAILVWTKDMNEVEVVESDSCLGGEIRVQVLALQGWSSSRARRALASRPESVGSSG